MWRVSTFCFYPNYSRLLSQQAAVVIELRPSQRSILKRIPGWYRHICCPWVIYFTSACWGGTEEKGTEPLYVILQEASFNSLLKGLQGQRASLAVRAGVYIGTARGRVKHQNEWDERMRAEQMGWANGIYRINSNRAFWGKIFPLHDHKGCCSSVISPGDRDNVFLSWFTSLHRLEFLKWSLVRAIICYMSVLGFLAPSLKLNLSTSFLSV